MPPKLLLADDSITVQRVIALTFAGEGLEVVTVGDGDQAVDRIARDRPEIVLADVSMPGRDGYAVAEFVKRSADHAATTRVVLLTGAFEPVDELRTRRLGIDGVLAKPFEPQMAIGLVKRLLDQPPVQATADDGEPAAAADGGSPEESAARPEGLGETNALGGATGLAAGYPFEPSALNTQAPSESDDYFRRLDEALATAGLTPAPPPRRRASAGPAVPGTSAGMGEPATADAPAVEGLEESSRMEPSMTTAAHFNSHEDPPTIVLPLRRDAVAGEARQPAPSLVDAFAALLAAEQGESAATVPQSTGTPEEHDALVEAVTRRVLERMTDAAVRDIVTARVLDVAERIVREEIERIKAQAAEE